MESKIEGKIVPIKWEQVSEGLFTLNCPICGKVWEEYEKEGVTPCEHLKFRLIKGCEADFYDKWYHDDFDILEVWDGKKTDVIDTVYKLSEIGMSCGPVWTSVRYGVKNDS